MDVTMKNGNPLDNSNIWCTFAANKPQNRNKYEQCRINKDDFRKRNESW